MLATTKASFGGAASGSGRSYWPSAWCASKPLNEPACTPNNTGASALDDAREHVGVVGDVGRVVQLHAGRLAERLAARAER